MYMCISENRDFTYKETIYSGSRSAARGGYSDVCTMPNLDPVPDCYESIMEQRKIIERDAAVNVHPYASREYSIHTESSCFPAYSLSHFIDKLSVECRAEVYRTREYRSPCTADSVERFSREYYGDSEAAVLDKVFLQLVMCLKGGIVVVNEAYSVVAAYRYHFVKTVVCVRLTEQLWRGDGFVQKSEPLIISVCAAFSGGSQNRQVLHFFRNRSDASSLYFGNVFILNLRLIRLKNYTMPFLINQAICNVYLSQSCVNNGENKNPCSKVFTLCPVR